MRAMRWGGLALLLGALGSWAPPVSAASVYYVANDGNDADTGLSPAAAWSTIAHVNAQAFQPGDSVLFKRGDTWRDTLYVHSSGTSDAWITFGAYGTGARPRILGSEQATGWTQVAPNVWQSSTSLGNPYQGGYSYAEVFFETATGTEWGEHQTYDASFSQMTAEYDWSWNANALYVYAPGNPGSRYVSVEVPQRDRCLRFPSVDGVTVLAQDYVQYVAIDGLALRYAMTNGIYPGYNEVPAHGLKVTNCEIGFIGVKGGSAAYGIAAWHSDMLIQNNDIHDCGRRGVSLNTYTTFTPGLTVSNVIIDGNQFSNGFHTTGPDISTLPGSGQTFTHFTISNNVIDDSGRAGEAIDKGCYASSCTSNSIYVSSEGNAYSDFTIVRNVILGSTSRAILLIGLDDVHVLHNSIYGSHPGARPYGLVVFNDTTNIDLRNNVIEETLPYDGGANDARCVMDQGTSSFAVRDGNLYFEDDADQPFTGSENGVGGWDTFMSEWDSWRTASGFEAHSPRPSPPRFVDPAGGDLTLMTDSPAIDTGVVIPGVNDGYQGTGPDIGAFERATPTLSVHDGSTQEGDSGTSSLTVTVTVE